MNQTGRPLDRLAPSGADEQRIHGAYTSRPWRRGRLSSAGATGTLARATRRASVDGARRRSRTPARSAWRAGIALAYHWLDDRGQPDRLGRERTALPALEPGERASVEAPGAGADPARAVPASRSTSSPSIALVLGARQRPDGRRRRRRPAPGVTTRRRFPSGSSRLPDGPSVSPRRTRRGTPSSPARSRGTAACCRRRPRALAPYEPGPGRIPGFSHPLVCPSVMDGVELERLPDVDGLPAFAAPLDEPWLYDGRIVLRAVPQRRR